ncbi:MAG: hypothetical protein FWD61_14105 [Phycisphaerales bacterium]|nr:hypothetical protein [Phycisphaerales bacterium]
MALSKFCSELAGDDIDDDFAAMIASLPLSKAEKAEAVGGCWLDREGAKYEAKGKPVESRCEAVSVQGQK